MDLTGVFIQVTKGNDIAYMYMVYQRAYHTMIEHKEMFDACLDKCICTTYFDIGKQMESILQRTTIGDMIVSASKTHIIIRSKTDSSLYEKLHENPYKTSIDTIPIKLHDSFAQRQTITTLSSLFEKGCSRDEFLQTLVALKR